MKDMDVNKCKSKIMNGKTGMVATAGEREKQG